MKIRLHKTGLARGGYIDPSKPHAINHLIVGDFGNEEILLACCDDGDVISYKTYSVELAIRHRQQCNFRGGGCLSLARMRYTQDRLKILHQGGGCPHLLPTHSVEPWFAVSVGHSAWGLSIQKEARLIAVSSNSRQVDVFAPALCHGKRVSFREIQRKNGLLSKDVQLDGISRAPWPNSRPFKPNDRTINQLVHTGISWKNIPSIAFFNSDLHKDAQWLAVTSIDGTAWIYDLAGMPRFYPSKRSRMLMSPRTVKLAYAHSLRSTRLGRYAPGSTTFPDDTQPQRHIWRTRHHRPG